MNNKEIIPYAVLGIGSILLVGSVVFFFIDPIKKAFRKKVGCNGKFLFIGDSNTNATYSYADLLKKACPQATVVKGAGDSMGTGWMLDRLKAELNKGIKYDVISILGGSNDLGNPNQEATYDNLNAMYKLAKAHGAIVVAISPPNKNFLWGSTRYCPTSQSNCKAFPEGIQRLDKLVDFIHRNPNKDVFINYNKITDRKDYFLSDMQHGNPDAQKALFEKFKQQVL
jgi:lysophospholipase L1-like esterase